MSDKQKGASDDVRWAIAPEWFTENGRSFPAVLKSYLCPTCAKHLADKKEPAVKNLLASLQNCCSRSPGFFSDKLPIMESTFRLFLHNGNSPLTIDQLSSELGKLSSGNIYRTSSETLQQVLNNDRFYGLQPVQD
jgi:hypothetical protein